MDKCIIVFNNIVFLVIQTYFLSKSCQIYKMITFQDFIIFDY